jgi:hypothetical protein
MAAATTASSQYSLEDTHFPANLNITLNQAIGNTILVYRITSHFFESLDKWHIEACTREESKKYNQLHPIFKGGFRRTQHFLHCTVGKQACSKSLLELTASTYAGDISRGAATTWKHL